jgi:antitoxin component of MazEF toxin-antitoxin module
VAEIDTEVKRWGNSLGVRLPRALLRGEGIAEGDRVHLRVEKGAPASPLWGILNKYPRRKRIRYEDFKADERRRERAREKRLGLR